MNQYTKSVELIVIGYLAFHYREILDPDGDVICRVLEGKDEEKTHPGNTSSDVLLSHLNR